MFVFLKDKFFHYKEHVQKIEVFVFSRIVLGVLLPPIPTSLM